MDFSAKTAVVTGASSGIGLALTRRLESLGCRVMAVARSIADVDFPSPPASKYPCDVSTRENVDRLFDDARVALGDIDLLFCNAGFAYYGPIAAADWDAIERIYRLNVFSAIYSALKMKEMHGSRPYRVAVTASAMSFLSVPGYALYASTKAALRGFAAAYRYELGAGQRLHMAYPIATRTEFFDAAGAGTPRPWPSQSAETVAAAIVNGVRADRNDIFPSRLFHALNLANGALPFIHKGIAAWENRKLRAFAARERRQPRP